MWCAVHVDAREGTAIEHIAYLRQSRVQRYVGRDLNRGFRLKSVGPTRPLERERAVIQDIDLFV